MHITLSVSKFNDVITAACYSTVRAEHEEKALGWDSVPEGCQHSQSDTCAKTLLCIFIAFYPHRGIIHNWRTMQNSLCYIIYIMQKEYSTFLFYPFSCVKRWRCELAEGIIATLTVMGDMECSERNGNLSFEEFRLI